MDWTNNCTVYPVKNTTKLLPYENTTVRYIIKLLANENTIVSMITYHIVDLTQHNRAFRAHDHPIVGYPLFTA